MHLIQIHRGCTSVRVQNLTFLICREPQPAEKFQISPWKGKPGIPCAHVSQVWSNVSMREQLPYSSGLQVPTFMEMPLWRIGNYWQGSVKAVQYIRGIFSWYAILMHLTHQRHYSLILNFTSQELLAALLVNHFVHKVSQTYTIYHPCLSSRRTLKNSSPI